MGISVIVPLFNKAPFLEPMLGSFVGQLGPDDELLVVDDGSTDGSLEIAYRFVNHQVRVYRMPCNSGPGATRNYGALNASGAQLLFFDADDLAHPDLLVVLRRAIALYPGEAIWSYRIAHQSRGEDMDSSRHLEAELQMIKRLPRHAFAESSLEGHPVCTASSTCVSASVFQRVGGFHPDLRFGEDPELWARLSADYSIIFIDSTLAFYREVLSGSAYGYRAIPGSVKPYVNTLFKLAERHGDLYRRLAFWIMVRNTIFSLASGCGYRQVRENLPEFGSPLAPIRRFSLWLLSCVPGIVYRSLLSARKVLVNLH